MKLSELFKFTGEEQTMKVIITDAWCITASAEALGCCLSEEVQEYEITSINAEDDELIVCVSCKKPGHDGCKYEELGNV